MRQSWVDFAANLIPIGVQILESRGEGVRRNVKRVRPHVRQPQLRYNNISPNN